MKDLKVSEVMQLTEEESIAFVESLEQPVEVNSKLLELAKLYKNEFHREDLIPNIKGKELL